MDTTTNTIYGLATTESGYKIHPRNSGLPVLACDEPLDSLFAQLLAGDLSAREKLIMAAEPLAGKTFSKFTRTHNKYRYIYEQLKGESKVAVIEAIDSLAQRRCKPRDLGQYLVRSIRNRLQEKCDVDSRMIGPSATVIKQDRAKARILLKKIRAIECRAHNDCRPLTPDERDKVARLRQERNLLLHKNPEPFRLRDHEGPAPDGVADDLMDAILSLCVNGQEQEFVALRAAGYEDAEIAARLRVSTKTVERIRARLGQRLAARSESLGA